jgi:hypothetical protein
MSPCVIITPNTLPQHFSNQTKLLLGEQIGLSVAYDEFILHARNSLILIDGYDYVGSVLSGIDTR